MGWHITPIITRKWSVRKAGALRVARHFDNPEDAKAYAVIRAKEDRKPLYIHNDDGRIQERIDLSTQGEVHE
jgi:hypothetical protein